MILSGLYFEVFAYTGRFTEYPISAGVYVIVLEVRGKSKIMYIGSTEQFKTRITSHVVASYLKKNKPKTGVIKILFHRNKNIFRKLEDWLLGEHKPEFNIRKYTRKCPKVVVNYINRNRKDGYLTEAITKEFQSL